MNLDAQVKNKFNISEILKKLLLRVNKLEKNSNVPSGDFIPLTGTEEGKPITGDLKIESYSGKKIKSYLQGEGGNAIDLTRADQGLFFESYYGEGTDGVMSAELAVNGSNVMYTPMNGAEETSIGFCSSTDHSDRTSGSVESDKRIYAQRSYVDKANSYSADEVLTGGTWIDGKPIYRKVVEIPDFGIDNNFAYSYNSNFKVIDVKTLIKSFDQDTYIKEHSIQNMASIGGVNLSSEISIDSNEIYVVFQEYNAQTETWESGFNNNEGIIILEYTKTTD